MLNVVTELCPEDDDFSFFLEDEDGSFFLEEAAFSFDFEEEDFAFALETDDSRVSEEEEEETTTGRLRIVCTFSTREFFPEDLE